MLFPRFQLLLLSACMDFSARWILGLLIAAFICRMQYKDQSRIRHGHQGHHTHGAAGEAAGAFAGAEACFGRGGGGC